MTTGSIRRAQLVTPFGVGAMSVLVNGTSVITAGLDHWYSVDDPTQLELDEYQAQDWRLEARLRVREFRLPPDYRPRQRGKDLRNTNLSVPVLRFPRWSFCMYCKRLELSPLTMAQPVECPDSKHKQDADGRKKRPPRMSQVPFIAICAHGHLDDFPFREWVHRSHSPGCRGTLRLESRGGGGLEGQVVVCDPSSMPKGCSAERSLDGIMNSHWENQVERTHLTDQLAADERPFYCTGSRPWLAELDGSCSQPIRGALRGAGNVYFPKVESSIYLPRQVGAVSAELHKLMNRADVRPILRILNRIDGAGVTAAQIRAELPHELFKPMTDHELLAGYRDMFGHGSFGDSGSLDDSMAGGNEDAEDAVETLTGNDEWRYPEYQLLREIPVDDLLTSTDPGVHEELSSFLDRVRRLETLTETRALRGFTRVRDEGLKLTRGKRLLRRRQLPIEHDWLPAYVVKGEGIYLELDQQRLEDWEQRPKVIARSQKIIDHHSNVARQRGLQQRQISPRFVLLHTLGHLLMNELVFACGYSSASLRERLYVSERPNHRMAGLLIYTAAGDSEGTMGGLVRMARPDALWSVVANALSGARWCSTDPVCMDMGEKGQGPDSCNLAACHGCALVPETSCEEFNRFLDRGLVVGTFRDPGLGYFADLLLA
ncbi:uncharacterized protein DUF1998 [Nocardia bhagyanarayanae]|uniref:Uncharacterized protein DUF1998 n=1 Tax=Nocardia bhagyanarayanae TaxID=1215925 RepID=A0A543FBT9_9NOCA|nr:DUF1998 domain-containing protein [Nocardia bhagyanarayanae]TQM31297.1 uncharacterized protein DUF1998 [Nocardia bhagyanarayanae]